LLAAVGRFLLGGGDEELHFQHVVGLYPLLLRQEIDGGPQPLGGEIGGDHRLQIGIERDRGAAGDRERVLRSVERGEIDDAAPVAPCG